MNGFRIITPGPRNPKVGTPILENVDARKVLIYENQL